MKAHTIAITPGEPAGIGPDLAIVLAQQQYRQRLVLIGDPDLLTERALMLGLPFTAREYRPGDNDICTAGEIFVAPISLSSPAQPGVGDIGNAPYVIATLDRAIAGCQSGEFGAMVTGPVNKAIINDSGMDFSGHTEYLADKTGGTPVMMLAAADFRVALATTHLPLSGVPAAITPNALETVLTILNGDLRRRFGIQQPRILVCGLNPHAGEGGYLGDEEIKVITPVLNMLRDRGLQLEGPLPADTLFTPKYLDNADAVLAMYHDQGLPVLKFAGFGQAVNVTLGLPIVRTSVDHGTAFDLAGTGRADAGSLRAAVDMASAICESGT